MELAKAPKLPKLPKLEDVLAYKNPRVLRMYRQNYPHNRLTAEEAFSEMLKYLWIARKHALDLEESDDPTSLPRHLVMLLSMREIDEIWHEFILNTREYTEFCQEYFGDYLHHLGDVSENLPGWREDEKAEVRKLLPYIYDHLGAETLKIWFRPYLES